MSLHILSLIVFLFIGEVFAINQCAPSFYENYEILWGEDYFKSYDQGQEVQLSLTDPSSGAEFISKSSYGSGSFSMSMKLPGNDSTGVATIFKIESFTTYTPENWVELEFLYVREIKAYLVQTNVYAIDTLDRKQIIRLWFDPTASFHDYTILWNPHQIVVSVDEVPIRVFRNNSKKGVPYPTKPMKVVASICNKKALDQLKVFRYYGETTIDWSHAPFIAQFRNFTINGCVYNGTQNSCYSSEYWWNKKKYLNLTLNQVKLYRRVKDIYMIYNYCTDDKFRFPNPPPECQQLGQLFPPTQ
ncbi:xyloglucan endotransglucosylase/hydrolase protein 2-like [Cornus florida]|uniref:xyloglucan endotransglucosylase/hydrolase protein 2-like n=1 Tax=Cornus florida TaxID=4283 RepID=UPI00289C004C|nr:xyloglucan endotransglucosylase/hydrolase protein 2-like [Cornus florida]